MTSSRAARPIVRLANLDVGRHLRLIGTVVSTIGALLLLLLLAATAGASHMLVIRTEPQVVADLVAPDGNVYLGIGGIRSQDRNDEIALDLVDGVTRKVGLYYVSRTAVGSNADASFPLLVPIVVLAIPGVFVVLNRDVRLRRRPGRAANCVEP